MSRHDRTARLSLYGIALLAGGVFAAAHAVPDGFLSALDVTPAATTDSPTSAPPGAADSKALPMRDALTPAEVKIQLLSPGAAQLRLAPAAVPRTPAVSQDLRRTPPTRARPVATKRSTRTSDRTGPMNEF